MLRKREETQKPEEIIAFLGKGTSFKGVITYDGAVRIDGRVEGEIVTKGTLVVGESAELTAEISAGTVICGGRVEGNVQAAEKVHLINRAKVSGTIRTPSLVIDDGVIFNGTVEMPKDGAPTE